MLPFLNNPKDLDPSYKMDLPVDLWDCFGRTKLRFITEEILYSSKFCHFITETCLFVKCICFVTSIVGALWLSG